MSLNYGIKQTKILGDGSGSSAENASCSALAIKKLTGTNTDGVYWINLPVVGPTQSYCLMNSDFDGGGWMLAMKAAQSTTFPYSSSYWESNNVLNHTDHTLNSADAKYEVMNHFKAGDFFARFPDVPSGGTMGSNLGGWTWHHNAINIRRPLIDFFRDTPDNTYLLENSDVQNWQGTLNGPFSTQGGWRKYGFNLNDGARQARWGFLWNNEGYPGSNDVEGGIGMGNRAYYSAGDYRTCCQIYTGVNRRMRLEFWVR